MTSTENFLWEAKPFMKKTIIKFLIIFIPITVLLTIAFAELTLIIPAIWILAALLYFGVYYLSKNSFIFHILDKSVRIDKSWVFGNYTRELTFDQITDIRINQGIIARMFNCGSLIFVTKTGLEVGSVVRGGGVGPRGILVGGGAVTPTVVKSRGNTFWDVLDPKKAREILMSKLVEWRTVYQQASMANSLNVIAGRGQTMSSVSAADEIIKLKSLYDNGAITKEEFEKVKKKLIQ